MKGNPVNAGRPVEEYADVIRSRVSGSNHAGFFFGLVRRMVAKIGDKPMDKSNTTMARQIAKAAIAFEQRRTGNHVPKSVTVVLCEGTLVITLHEALSPAEKVMSQSAAGAAKVQEFHRQLFASSSDSLRQEITRITGMEVREASAQIEPASGAVVQAFTTGAVVQVFLLSGSGPTETWSESAPGNQS